MRKLASLATSIGLVAMMMLWITPASTLATSGTCVDADNPFFSSTTYTTGQVGQWAGQQFYGVKARIDIPTVNTLFTPCSGGQFGSTSGGVYGSIGLMDFSDGSHILQFGAEDCDYPLTICTHTARWVLIRNCGGGEVATDLGAASSSPTDIQIIWNNPNDRWDIYITGVLQSTHVTGASYPCLRPSAGNLDTTLFTGERKDRGDGLGSSTIDTSMFRFWNEAYTINHGWVDQTPLCNRTDPASGQGLSACFNESATHGMNMYTYNSP